jgi:EmrB/QacA subfamily drug resistance transporter
VPSRDPVTYSADVVSEPDPRRWLTLAVVVASVLIVAMDNTILNVAIPTIVRDLDSELSSVQWVVTGYSLTFATLLIIGGRIGDVYGARRTFIAGAALFGAGSALASLATSVPVLVIGEAIIEGLGASLMMPATLAILTNTFQGRERATAFAAWGATAGVAVTLGPLLGGYLTTGYSWRWSLRINLIVTPLAILGALLFMRRDPHVHRRPRIDVPGALLVGSGTFLIVLALSEGERFGWVVSIVPVALAGGAALLVAFVKVERSKERLGRDPLFTFSQLRHRSFRYGLLTTSVLAMGQLTYVFVLPIFLQEGRGLSAQTTGLWFAPAGLAIVFGAQLGGHLTRRFGPTRTVRIGLLLESVGLTAMALTISPSLTLLRLLPSILVFNTGIGFASSQLTSVVLADIAPEHAGAASGASTTVRQIGAALGVAVAGALLTAHAALETGARTALLFAAGVVTVGFLFSLLLPSIGAAGRAQPIEALDLDPTPLG